MVVWASRVRRDPRAMWGAVRSGPSSRPFSSGFGVGLFSLLRVAERFRCTLGGHHGWRAPFAIRAGSRRRFFWQWIASIPEFLLGLSARLGGAISSQPVVFTRMAPHQPGMAALCSSAFRFSYREFPLGIGLYPLPMERETVDAASGSHRGVLRNLPDLHAHGTDVLLAADVRRTGPRSSRDAEHIRVRMGSDRRHLAGLARTTGGGGRG